MIAEVVGWRKPPVIEIDYHKCLTPLDCKKCISVCPQDVFYIETMKHERFRESHPKEAGAYRVSAKYRYACTACNSCIIACPIQALRVFWEEK